MLRNSACSLRHSRPVAGRLLQSLCQPALPGSLASGRKRGLVVPVNVEALGEMWLHHGWRSGHPVPGGAGPPAKAPCFSPFDPVVWDGKTREQLFNQLPPGKCWRDAEASVWLLRTASAAPWKTGRADGPVKIHAAGSWRPRPVAGGGGEDHPWFGGCKPGD